VHSETTVSTGVEMHNTNLMFICANDRTVLQLNISIPPLPMKKNVKNKVSGV